MAITGFPQSSNNGGNAANVGDLSQLPTTDKTNIVNSIIELAAMLNAGAWVRDEDFPNGTIANTLYAAVSSGTNAGALAISIGGVLGVLSLVTGTTATGFINLSDSGSASKFTGGTGELVTIVKFQLPVLSTGTQRYNVRVGFGDLTNSADAIDSAGYIEYSDNVNSGNWVYATSSNSTRTKVNSSVAVVAQSGDNWTYLKIIVNPLGTQSDFYINNVLIGSITTNIPTTAARVFNNVIQIVKTVGTTSTALNVDRIYQHFVRNDANSANWRL